MTLTEKILIVEESIRAPRRSAHQRWLQSQWSNFIEGRALHRQRKSISPAVRAIRKPDPES